MTCASCGQPTDSCFEIVRVARSTRGAPVSLCSVVCVVRWAHDFATSSGMKLVMAAHGAVQTTRAAVGGLIKAIKGS